MKGMLAIARREVLSSFVSPVAYFVITGFVLLAGYFFFNLVAYYNMSIQQYAQFGQTAANLNEWVVQQYYFTLIVILVFLVPLLTMRLFSEEKRRGTFELLVTSPLTVPEIVLGKFLGIAVVVAIMMFGAVLFPGLLWAFGNPGPELAPILTGIAGLTLCTLAFVSIGLAFSAVTENQIVAGISTMVALLFIYMIHAPGEALGGEWQHIFESLSPLMQLRDLVRGVVTLSSVVYFASFIVLGLSFSYRVLEAHRWR